MESSLIPDVQLIGQLEKEIEREKRLLEQENSQLENLTKNAAREESLRKNQMKKVFTSRSFTYKDAPIIEGECFIKRAISCDKFGFRANGAGLRCWSRQGY
jgi:hypothetical protein